MKKVELEELRHGSTKDMVTSVFEGLNIKFVVKLDEALEKRGLNQTQLALLLGLRPGTVSDFIRGNKSALNKVHLAAIMTVLRITDIKEIIDIEFDLPTITRFQEESTEWIEHDIIPQDVLGIFDKNIKAQFSLKKGE